MNVELIVTFAIVQFMMSPKFKHVAYSTTAMCDVILNSIALFTFLKGSIGHQHFGYSLLLIIRNHIRSYTELG